MMEKSIRNVKVNFKKYLLFLKLGHGEADRGWLVGFDGQV